MAEINRTHLNTTYNQTDSSYDEIFACKQFFLEAFHPFRKPLSMAHACHHLYHHLPCMGSRVRHPDTHVTTIRFRIQKLKNAIYGFSCSRSVSFNPRLCHDTRGVQSALG